MSFLVISIGKPVASTLNILRPAEFWVPLICVPNPTGLHIYQTLYPLKTTRFISLFIDYDKLRLNYPRRRILAVYKTLVQPNAEYLSSNYNLLTSNIFYWSELLCTVHRSVQLILFTNTIAVFVSYRHPEPTLVKVNQSLVWRCPLGLLLKGKIYYLNYRSISLHQFIFHWVLLRCIKERGNYN